MRAGRQHGPDDSHMHTHKHTHSLSLSHTHTHTHTAHLNILMSFPSYACCIEDTIHNAVCSVC